jgi:hypothetical protein
LISSVGLKHVTGVHFIPPAALRPTPSPRSFRCLKPQLMCCKELLAILFRRDGGDRFRSKDRLDDVSRFLLACPRLHGAEHPAREGSGKTECTYIIHPSQRFLVSSLSTKKLLMAKLHQTTRPAKLSPQHGKNRMQCPQQQPFYLQPKYCSGAVG